MFAQFLFNDRIIIPEDEGIVLRLILSYPKLSVNIVLHVVIITIQVVGRYVHQYGNVCTEVVHVIQLETTQLNNIVVVLFGCNLQS
ncbi:hypothetical protein SDC9_113350 [bioreactor metagenome]|uniref:Uncharacterized protein n=1 Tax=bioreactor metagenome TaxID=1076179 RepID=A0A645BT78_9ZZZZ